MAKTRYGQRMYRARAARAEEMQSSGAEEYTVNAKSGSSILVEESAQPDYYMVTFLQDGSPMGSGRAQPYSAEAIKDEYGVDVLKGKLIDGATTEGYSEALAAMRATNANLIDTIHVSEYLQGQRDFSSLDSSDLAAISNAVSYARASSGSDAGYSLLEALNNLRVFYNALKRS